MKKLLIISLISSSLLLVWCFNQGTTPEIKNGNVENIQSWTVQTWSIENNTWTTGQVVSNSWIESNSWINIVNNYYSFIEKKDFESAFNLKINNISIEKFKSLYQNTKNIKSIDYFEIDSNNFLLLIEDTENSTNIPLYYLVNSKIENNKINSLSSNEINKNIWLKLINTAKEIKNSGSGTLISFSGAKLEFSSLYKGEKAVYNIEKTKLENILWVKDINFTVNWDNSYWFESLEIKTNFLFIGLSWYEWSNLFIVFDKNNDYDYFNLFKQINNYNILWKNKLTNQNEVLTDSFILLWNEESVKKLRKIDVLWQYLWLGSNDTIRFDNTNYIFSSNYSLINLDSWKEYSIDWIQQIRQIASNKDKKWNIYFNKDAFIVITKMSDKLNSNDEASCNFDKYIVYKNWETFSLSKNSSSNNAICSINAYDWSISSITLDWKNVYWD